MLLSAMTPADLRAFRARLDCTQLELAALLGVDVGTVSCWERGTQGIPPYLDLALQLVAPSFQPEGAASVFSASRRRSRT